MKGILEKTTRGWVVNAWEGEGEEVSFIKCYPLHPSDVGKLEPSVLGSYGEVEFEIIRGFDDLFDFPEAFAKISDSYYEKLEREIDVHMIKMAFPNEDDMRAYVKQYENEEELRKEGAIDFAKWLAKEWMSMWVEDKWLWENVSVDTNDQSLWKGYYTEEELYEIYLKSEQ